MKRISLFINLLVKSERGAVIILAAFLLVFVLIGMAALSVDVGYLYLQKRHLQTTADSAALAAAWELPWENSEITEAAREYAEYNYIDYSDSDTVIVVSDAYGDNNAVRVEITKNYPLFFALAPPIGQTDSDVYATAVAIREYTFVDILPFMVIDYEDYEDNDFLDIEDIEGWNLIDDWEAEEFKRFLKGDHPESPDLDEGVTIYTWINQNQGNWGLVNMSHFSDRVDSKDSISGPDLQVILNYGIDRPFCEDESLLRNREAGQVSSVDTNPPSNPGRDGIKLSDLLADEENQEKGFFIILISPRRAAEGFSGNHTAFTLDEFLIAHVKPLTLNGNYLEGVLRDVWLPSECDQIPKELKKWIPVLIE